MLPKPYAQAGAHVAINRLPAQVEAAIVAAKRAVASLFSFEFDFEMPNGSF